MPKRTEAEWQTLDPRIAREMLGWRLEPLHYNYGRCATPRWTTAEREFTGFFPPSVADAQTWQPHKNVSQAMQVLDEMSSRRKGAMHNWFYRIQSYPQVTGHLYNVFLHTCIYPRHSQAPLVLEYSADAYILTHAICLAIEQVIDAQKEEIQGAQEN